jgi:hypothetical protein
LDRTILLKVWRLTTVFRLMRQLQISSRQSPTSVLPADILSTTAVTDEKKNVGKGGVELLSELVMVFLQYKKLFHCSRKS